MAAFSCFQQCICFPGSFRGTNINLKNKKKLFKCRYSGQIIISNILYFKSKIWCVFFVLILLFMKYIKLQPTKGNITRTNHDIARCFIPTVTVLYILTYSSQTVKQHLIKSPKRIIIQGLRFIFMKFCFILIPLQD